MLCDDKAVGRGKVGGRSKREGIYIYIHIADSLS